MNIAIIGAGMAGLACATALIRAGHSVKLYDKGRRAGGRMSTRRVSTPAGEASFDHGAQYFTARDPAFRRQVAEWQAAGIVTPWLAAGPDAWVGTPGMNAPVKLMAEKLDIDWDVQVNALVSQDGSWRVADSAFDAALLAVPSENALPLLTGCDAAMAARAAATPAQPCWTVLVAFASALPEVADIMREQGIIGWAARNSAKPARSGPESWVIQAGPGWSKEHLEAAPDAIIAALLAAFEARIGTKLPPTLALTAHRWRYARSGAAGEGCLWNPSRRLGVCGDWLLGPRVECAWLSGVQLAAAVSS